jgi:hypothetical protein
MVHSFQNTIPPELRVDWNTELLRRYSEKSLKIGLHEKKLLKLLIAGRFF